MNSRRRLHPNSSTCYLILPSQISPATPSHGHPSSTPGPSHGYVIFPRVLVSEISSASEMGGSERDQPEMSSVESIHSEESGTGSTERKSLTPGTSKARRKLEQKRFSSSFADPFDLSIDVTMQSSYEDSDDPDYKPSFVLSAVLPDALDDEAEEMAYEEVEFGLEVDTNTIDEEGTEDVEEKPGIMKVTTDDQCDEVCSDTLCLSFLPQLKMLADITVNMCSTAGCTQTVTVVDSFVGSALYFKWVCTNGHVSKEWCSQPILNKRLHYGDFLVCGSILASGNNYGKLCLWAKLLNLKFPSSDQFHRIQTTYLVPTIDQYWEEHQREVLNTFRGQQIVVLGDGRNDSPGHCSQYCSYTLMEDTTKKILTIKTLDKRIESLLTWKN